LFFDRPGAGERAVLVHLDLIGDDFAAPPQEFLELAESAGAKPVEEIFTGRFQPNAHTLVRPGKLQEIAQSITLHEAELVIFDHTLSPSQQRNLEKELKCRVLDRTGLILDIFAQRARTHEGKLQVELAQLHYVSTRLIRGWTHLERQKGGIGLRGPGETQLETDRRLIRGRIKSIQARLEKVQKQRALGRRARQRSSVPSVSLVGYTNAGKSTLFNRLCEAEVYAADQLFATLDPTLRRIDVPDLGPVVLADTVGFIRKLPHKLVEAFKATLEEAVEADLLLHVLDASDPDRDETRLAVEEVLEEIGAAGIKTLLVCNKIDALDAKAAGIERGADGNVDRVWVSAQTGEGMEALQQAISEVLGEDMVHGRLALAPHQLKFRASLHEHKAVLNEDYDERGQCIIELRMPRSELLRQFKLHGLDKAQLTELNSLPRSA
jgi:GTP-binding protein HflX